MVSSLFLSGSAAKTFAEVHRAGFVFRLRYVIRFGRNRWQVYVSD
jgi:hypothetical protein